ncbi:MAG: exonuclease SbcCD subunit D [Candidatus Thorarchaeota archaeon]
MDDVNFYLFPYLKFGRLETWYEEYEKWLVNNQQPDPSKISIAVAHGMDRGMDLHELILQYKYDYVALGHDHNQRRIKKNAWQSGSTAKYTFAERDQKKGVLEVQINKGEDPLVTPHLISKTRRMKQINMTLSTDLSVVDFEKKLKEKISEFKADFNGETATRLKFSFEGSILLSNWWNMEDVLMELQKDCFGDKYNLLEFRWDSIDLKKRAPISLEKSAQLYDYLIEDPVVDFERYIRSLSLENEKQAMQFIDLGANIIEEVFTHTTIEEGEKKEESS